ncbi:glycoside hydrolase family 88 protein [Burkholderia sp. Cy-637]|uniref:glycoside hydrolase family 88 protein n=1 Tax=Burkholderia sp. Cy-637 TaxID=2608327 RepID=UPI00141FFA16|nr:glycoside hydrolase family 88 protein [Burkholderia sp. Cy-637]NIF89284.1 glycosyl hydrolase [Burkholderia sp. Cy-637]
MKQDGPPSTYFVEVAEVRSMDRHQAALLRCVAKLKATMPIVGLRNPKIGLPDLSWEYCDAFDWVIGFQAGQLWLAAALTGDPAFVIAAQARRQWFRELLRHPRELDHDTGFQFSLSCVADWKMTGNEEARALALKAASLLAQRHEAGGGYLKAWNSRAGDPAYSRFAAGRIIADTMQNLALLYWADREEGQPAYREIADAHALASSRHLIREDGSTYHTFLFDAGGEPLRGETRQGYAHESCWARGQAWLIHGFAQTYAYTRNPQHRQIAAQLAATAETLLGDRAVPPWDYRLPDGETPWPDSSAGAIMAAGLYLLAASSEEADKARWRAFADRLVDGLLDSCDLSGDAAAHGLLAHGAAHVPAGRHDNMLPYGDYYFMEALMRSQGHDRFAW